MRKQQNKNSDLDILVEFNDKIGIRVIDLTEELEKIVGLKVGPVSKNGAKEMYFQEIKSELVYA